MIANYAVQVLQEEKNKLKESLYGMQMLGEVGETINENNRTKLNEKIASLDVAIELLVEHRN